ncbi:MAG: TetR/AcrR family transcriptional regulator [Pseudomonadota bacterium]
MTKTEPTPDKKTKILEAATGLLAERGVQALTFENVASQAGMSRQLIRYYFSDIEALIVDLCDHLGTRYREILVAGILDVGEVGRLKFFLDFFFDLSADHPMPINLEAYDAMVAYSVGSTELRDRMCDQYKTLGQVIIHELAIAHPELDSSACEELSFLFVSMMHAHWSFVASLGYSRQHSQLARRAIDRLIASYIADPPEAPRMERPWLRGD